MVSCLILALLVAARLGLPPRGGLGALIGRTLTLGRGLQGHLHIIKFRLVVLVVHAHEDHVDTLDVLDLLLAIVVGTRLRLVLHVGRFQRERIAFLRPCGTTLSEGIRAGLLVFFRAVLPGVVRHALTRHVVALVGRARLCLRCLREDIRREHLGVQRAVVALKLQRRILGSNIGFRDGAVFAQAHRGRRRIHLEVELEVCSAFVALVLRHRARRGPLTPRDGAGDVAAERLLDAPIHSAGDNAGLQGLASGTRGGISSKRCRNGQRRGSQRQRERRRDNTHELRLL